jgi:hypothetical protein
MVADRLPITDGVSKPLAAGDPGFSRPSATETAKRINRIDHRERRGCGTYGGAFCRFPHI